MLEKPSVLVVESDPAVATVVASVLAQEEIASTRVASEEAALEVLARSPVDALLVDLDLPDPGALGLLRGAQERWPDVPVVILAKGEGAERAVEAVRLGATDFALVPIERDDLLHAVRKALALARHADRHVPERPFSPSRIVAASTAMQEVVHILDRAAHGSATVLLIGEAGSGKELAARTIHESGPRRDGPFVKVDCAALPDSMLEAELFGYEKGAFSGAAIRKTGRAELAHGGTLFLDEIGATSPLFQVKLLRLLQDHELERLGGTKPVHVDVRFIAATRRNLPELVARGRFRQDLYYRLEVIHVDVPPLRERREDIAPLARRFAETSAAALGRPDVRLSDDALAMLERQSWPGNVRQLQSFVERLVVLRDGPVIGQEDVEQELTRAPVFAAIVEKLSGAADGETQSQLRATEKRALEQALERSGDDRTIAARILGVSRRTLYRRLAAHGLVEA